MVGCYKSFIENLGEEGNAPDFKILSELHNTTKNNSTGEQTTYEDLLFVFLEQVFDRSEEELAVNLPIFMTELS